MSMIRLSCKQNSVCAPTQAGSFKTNNYSAIDGYGMLETFSNLTLKSSALGKDESGSDADKMKQYLQKELKTKISKLKPDKPVVIMIHGYDYDPGKLANTNMPEESENPHSRLYHFVNRPEKEEIKDHASSWPLRLGFINDKDGSSGLIVAFGWLSIYNGKSIFSKLFKKLYYKQAYKYATESSYVLIHLLHFLINEIKDHQIDIFAHSLGSRVVSAALMKIVEFASKTKLTNHNEFLKIVKSIGRVIFLGGAEYVSEVRKMFDPINDLQDNGLLSEEQGPYFYNFVAKHDLVLNLLAEGIGPKGNAEVIGHDGLTKPGTNKRRWMDLQLDYKKFQDWILHEFELKVKGDNPESCRDHWFYYTWKNNNVMYHKIFRERENWGHSFLRDPDKFKSNEPIPEGVR